MHGSGVWMLRNDQRMLGFLLHAPRSPFYSPKAARSRWRHSWKANLAFCRVAHRTVRCTTGQPLFMSGARFPSIPGATDRCNSGLVGAPDSPVPQPTVGAGHASPADCAVDRCAGDRWLTGQSCAPPDSPVNYSRTPPKTPEIGQFAGASLAHRTLSGAPPDSPVCQTEQSLGCSIQVLFFFSFL
jgi:hypothetical protein